MVERFGSVVTACAALAVSSVAGEREASACTPPRQGWYPSDINPGPENGVLVLGDSCHTGCEPLPAVENLVLKNETSELVPGSVIFSRLSGDRLYVEPGQHWVRARLDGRLGLLRARAQAPSR